MARFDSPLDGVKVAAPCSADWDKMVGDERVRFCQSCELNVYNLSGMSRAEAEGLIAGAQGRLCVRFYRRADGTVLTDNCPVGLRAVKQRVARAARAAVSAALGFLAGLGLSPAPSSRYQVMGAMAYDPARATVDLTAEAPALEVPAETPALVNVPPQGEDVGWVAGRLMPVEIDSLRRAQKVEGRAGRRR